MSLTKEIKDLLIKKFAGHQNIPRGLFELATYFRHNGSISFDYKEHEDVVIAVSNNFRYGSIVAQGKDIKELEKNIPDAILTSFDVPSSYAREAKIYKVDQMKREYAIA
ncbi:MAG TPA: hypothetical protein VGA49_00865 [Patescibacteria group bacterium]